MNIRAILLPLGLLAALGPTPMRGAEGEGFRMVTMDRVPEVLRTIANVSRANYERIRTWDGAVQVTRHIVYGDLAARQALKDSGLAADAIPSKVLEATEARIEFSVDVAGDLLYSKTHVAQPTTYKHTQTGATVWTRADTGYKVSLVTPEHYVYSDSSVRTGADGTRRLAVKEKRPKDCLPCEVPFVFDPRTLFGTPDNAWDTFPKMADHIAAHGSYTIDEREVQVEEKAGAAGVDYRIGIPWKSQTGQAIRISKTFAAAHAYNPVLVEFAEVEGEVLQRGTLDYERIDDIHLPVRTTFQRFAEQGGQEYYEKKAVFQNVRVNQPLASGIFTLPSIGLADGDILVDLMQRKQYTYEKGQLVYTNDLPDE